MFFTGSVSGIMVSKFGCRVTSLLGAIICAVSLASASVSQSLVVLYLSYSIPFGIGTSFIFNAGLVIVSNYFTRRRSLALGFVSAGQGLGVLVQGPLLQTLIDHYGWKTTYRIMAGVIFGVCLLGVTYDPNVKSDMEVENADKLASRHKKSPHQPREPRRCMFLDVSVWKIPAFVAINFSSAIAQFGHFVPQIHLVSLICLFNMTGLVCGDKENSDWFPKRLGEGGCFIKRFILRGVTPYPFVYHFDRKDTPFE